MRRTWQQRQMIYRLAAGLGSMASMPGAAHAQADYTGRTVEIVVGFSAGGGYDAYARAVGQHLGTHIPGQPKVIVRNMPGAGSLVLLNHLYSAAPKNGLFLGAFDPTLITAPLLGVASANFDASKFGWVGSASATTNVCVTWATSAVKSWDDMFRAGPPHPFGTTGPSDSRHQSTATLKNLFGANLQIIGGYTGSSEIRVAMERGEIAGNCGDSWSSMKSTAADLLRDKKVLIVAQFALQPNTELPGVVSVLEKARTPLEKAALTLLVAPQSAGRPLAVPPGTPPEALAALRRAYDATMTDPDYLATIGKMKLDAEPATGARIEAIIAELYKTPKDAVAAAAAAIK